MSFDPTTQETENETMMLLDITGSMSWPAAEGSNISRKSVLGEAIFTIVTQLGKEDSQAAHEESGGGLRTVTFADGRAKDLGDLNPGNLESVWNRIPWGGGTVIMPGWNKLMEVYADEFGDRPPAARPKLIALIPTDGDARDYHAFAQTLEQLGGKIYVRLAILGYGAEHDKALKEYMNAKERNPGHVDVVAFTAETNPEELARGLMAMIA